MTMDVTNWNLDENRDWHVRLEDSGTDITVELYTTQSDAQHQSNRRSYGSASYGSNSECILTADAGYSVDLYQADYTWHLRVAGENGDSTKVYKINAFTDLPSIVHSIFRNTTLISVKATYEINLHTKYKTVRKVPLGIHIPDISVGKIMTFDSTRRGVAEENQISNMTINGVVNNSGDARLTTNLELIKFSNLSKG